MNAVTGLAIESRNEAAFDAVYRRFTGDAAPFEEVAHEAKRFVLETAMSAELNVLAMRLDRIAQRDAHTRDFTLGALRRTLVATIAAFPIYRTYVTGRRRAAGRRNVHRARRGGGARARRLERRLDLHVPAPRAAGRVGRRRRARAVRRVRDEVPAAHRADHREGRRGHRVLPFAAADRAQRGRRRSRPLRHERGRVPPAEPAARAAPPEHDGHHRHARHEARRRRARTARRPLRSSGGMARARSHAGRG